MSIDFHSLEHNSLGAPKLYAKTPEFRKPKGIVKPPLPHLQYTMLIKLLRDRSGLGQEGNTALSKLNYVEAQNRHAKQLTLIAVGCLVFGEI
jgi:hypothetical protein